MRSDERKIVPSTSKTATFLSAIAPWYTRLWIATTAVSCHIQSSPAVISPLRSTKGCGMTDTAQGGPIEAAATTGHNLCPIHNIERNRPDLVTAGGCRKCHEVNL